MAVSPAPEGAAGQDPVVVGRAVKEEEKPDVSLREQVKHEDGEDFKAEDAKMDVSKVKVKKKSEDLVFSADSVEARLNLVGIDPFPIDLSRAVQDVIVPRAYISSQCRGSLQTMFTRGYPERLKVLYEKPHKNDSEEVQDGGADAEVKVDEDNAEDKTKIPEMFAFMNPDYQTMAPRLPGHPGLFFSTELCHGSGRGSKVYYLFTRISLHPALWQYMGSYEMRPCPSLTAEEWNRLTPKVKATWANEINEKGWGEMVRVRIRTRALLGREPTEEELKHSDVNHGPFGSPEMVISAYNNGDEKLAVWTLKCIGYDAEFQEAIAKGYREYVSPDATNGERGKKTSKTARSKPDNDEAEPRGSNRKSTKRKHASASIPNNRRGFSSHDSDSEYATPAPARKRARKASRNSDIESAYEELLPLTSKGTHSRPRAPRVVGE